MKYRLRFWPNLKFATDGGQLSRSTGLYLDYAPFPSVGDPKYERNFNVNTEI